MSEPRQEGPDRLPTVVVKVGKRNRKQIRQLGEEKGPLIRVVRDAVLDSLAAFGSGTERGQVIPVVVIYEQKRKNKRVGLLP